MEREGGFGGWGLFGLLLGAEAAEHAGFFNVLKVWFVAVLIVIPIMSGIGRVIVRLDHHFTASPVPGLDEVLKDSRYQPHYAKKIPLKGGKKV